MITRQSCRKTFGGTYTPFWKAVIKNSLNPRSMVRRLRNGSSTLRVANAMFLILKGFRMGLFKLALITATKLTVKEILQFNIKKCWSHSRITKNDKERPTANMNSNVEEIVSFTQTLMKPHDVRHIHSPLYIRRYQTSLPKGKVYYKVNHPSTSEAISITQKEVSQLEQSNGK
jgi:hypothetical protein